MSVLLCCQALSLSLFAQQQKVDTAHIYSIPEIMVSDPYQTREVRSASPLQVFNKEELKNLQALQVSDAVKHFAGVTVKDYGGIGGLKTVSIRSLGAQHTAVSYDGITVSDCQTGQVDIGRFSLNNVDRLSLNNGQSDNIFQPARFFASAGILNIQTLTPHFKEDKPTNIAAEFKTGSWGLVNPSLFLEQQLNKKWSMTANGEWMSSDGHYPFTLRYGNDADVQVSKEKRRNTDVENLRAEISAFANLSDKEQWRLKAYYYQSSRGLPNATTLYYDFSRQNLQDKNTFIQSQYKKEFSRKWVFQTSAKWNWSYQNYQDPDALTSVGGTDNSYYQQEYYLSASALYRIWNNLSFSLSTDGSINTMNANLQNFVSPTRYSWLTAFANKVFEYIPAPGQFINTTTSAYEDGFSAEQVLERATEKLKKKSVISLGGFGGTITVGFHQSIRNSKGEYDFRILGNASYNQNTGTGALGGSAEPGIVLVSKDENGNGLPDDEWYELAGSEYGKDTETRNYEITYYRPQPASGDVRWTDNQGGEGFVYRNSYHQQDSYYPNWIEEDEITFRGTRLKDNAINEGGTWVGYCYPWGYADNHPYNSEFCQFKIDWAVDKKGIPVILDKIDFIKIYTAINQNTGWTGEISTEVMTVEDLHFEN